MTFLLSRGTLLLRCDDWALVIIVNQSFVTRYDALKQGVVIVRPLKKSSTLSIRCHLQLFTGPPRILLKRSRYPDRFKTSCP